MHPGHQAVTALLTIVNQDPLKQAERVKHFHFPAGFLHTEGKMSVN